MVLEFLIVWQDVSIFWSIISHQPAKCICTFSGVKRQISTYLNLYVHTDICITVSFSLSFRLGTTLLDKLAAII